MKRLKLEDFKLKNLKEEKNETTNQLLGQVLGDCHDEPKCIPVGNPRYGFDIPANDGDAQ